MSKQFKDCTTEEERQELRDKYLEMVFHQTIVQNGTLANIKERLQRIEDKLELMSRLKLEELCGINTEDIYDLFKR